MSTTTAPRRLPLDPYGDRGFATEEWSVLKVQPGPTIDGHETEPILLVPICRAEWHATQQEDSLRKAHFIPVGTLCSSIWTLEHGSREQALLCHFTSSYLAPSDDAADGAADLMIRIPWMTEGNDGDGDQLTCSQELEDADMERLNDLWERSELSAPLVVKPWQCQGFAPLEAHEFNEPYANRFTDNYSNLLCRECSSLATAAAATSTSSTGTNIQ